MCLLFTHFLILFFPIKSGTFLKSSIECNHWEAHGIITLSGCLFFEPFVPFLLKPFWYRCFGAKIGKNSNFAGKLIDPSITVIKDSVTISADSLILGHQISGNKIIIGPVVLEEHSTLGAKSIIFSNSTLGHKATLGVMSLATTNTIVPANDVWVGIPAKPLS